MNRRLVWIAVAVWGSGLVASCDCGRTDAERQREASNGEEETRPMESAGPAAQLDAGFEVDTPLSNLDETKLGTLCERTAAFAKREIRADRWCDYFSVSGACGAVREGSTDRQLRKMCEQPKAKCVDNYEAGDQGVLRCESLPTDTGCDVAVSTYESCLSRQVDSVVRYLEAVPNCSDVTVEDCRPDGLPEYQGGGFDACRTLRNQCSGEFTEPFGVDSLFDALQMQ